MALRCHGKCPATPRVVKIAVGRRAASRLHGRRPRRRGRDHRRLGRRRGRLLPKKVKGEAGAAAAVVVVAVVAAGRRQKRRRSKGKRSTALRSLVLLPLASLTERACDGCRRRVKRKIVLGGAWRHCLSRKVWPTVAR